MTAHASRLDQDIFAIEICLHCHILILVGAMQTGGLAIVLLLRYITILYQFVIQKYICYVILGLWGPYLSKHAPVMPPWQNLERKNQTHSHNLWFIIYRYYAKQYMICESITHFKMLRFLVMQTRGLANAKKYNPLPEQQ